MLAVFRCVGAVESRNFRLEAAGAAGKRKGNKGSGWKQSFRIRKILRKQSCGEWLMGSAKAGKMEQGFGKESRVGHGIPAGTHL